MTRWRWIPICCIALFAACGDPVSDSGPDRSEAQGPSAGADTLYTCGGDGSFEGERLEGQGKIEDEDSPLGEALRELMSGIDGVSAEDGWRIVWEKGDRVLVVAPNPTGEHPYQSAVFERAGSSWDPQGWGDCSPTVIVGDRSPVLWKLEDQPSEEATELAVVLEERACSGGRGLNADNIEIDIDYTEDSIAILVSADPLEDGFYTCPLNPSSFTIELDEPVGDRSLVDTAVYPPARRDV